MSLTTAVLSSSLNASLYPLMLNLTSFAVVFIIYAVVTLVMFLLAIRIIPDHRGLTLAAIEGLDDQGENS